MTHTIYVIDDNIFVREALIMLIEEEADLVICGAADTAVDALEAILRLQPDLVLTDYSLPGMTGVDLVERLGALKPEQRVALFTAHMEPAYVDRALAAGAVGYILKEDWPSIITGIRHVLYGNVYVSSELDIDRPCPSENVG